MNKIIVTIFCFLFFLHSNANSEERARSVKYQEKDFQDSVSLQGINKITARVSSLNIKTDSKINFGNLEIKLVKCWKAPPEQEPENKALLEIWEQVPGEEKKEIFSGWMFSSSPALSALEHPVYDVVVKECFNDKSKPEEASKE